MYLLKNVDQIRVKWNKNWRRKSIDLNPKFKAKLIRQLPSTSTLKGAQRTFLDESDSIAVRCPRTQHRKRPERSQWRIHCTESWNLLLFFLGNGPFPRYFWNLRLALCFSFLERKCCRIQWGWRGQYGRWSMESLIPPIDPQPGSWWSNLDWNRFWCDWDCSSRWRWSLHSF